jgi:hypothetical protein
MAAGAPTAYLLEWSLNGTFRDVSADLDSDYGVSIHYGRGAEGGSIGPGTMLLRLRNTTGDYTPDNPGSIWSPGVLERTQIRYNVTKGSTYQRFTGFVDTISPALTSLGDAGVELSCITEDGVVIRPFDSDYVEENRYQIGLLGGTWDCWSMDAGSNSATRAANLGNGAGTGRLVYPVKRKTSGAGAVKFGTGTMLEGRRGLKRGKR